VTHLQLLSRPRKRGSTSQYVFITYCLVKHRDITYTVPVLIRSRIFTSPYRPDRFWSPPNLLSNEYRDSLSAELKRPGREADHSPLTSAEVSTRIYTATLHSLMSSWRSAWLVTHRDKWRSAWLLTHRDNFTFFTLPPRLVKGMH
jgi:hypothetical protein